MNEEEMKEWMKEHYPDLTNFDNLQFVKDCEEEGIKKYKVKVREVVGDSKDDETDGYFLCSGDYNPEEIRKEERGRILKELGLE